MPQILLIRHAKAEISGSEPGDHARPLAEKGRKQSEILGRLLSEAGCVPDHVLLSTSRRTRETLQFMALPANPAIVEREDLYLADADEIDDCIEADIHEAQCLAVIGHNPGISVLAWQYLQAGGTRNENAAHDLRHGFKTAFAARFDWNEGKPVLLSVLDPRSV